MRRHSGRPQVRVGAKGSRRSEGTLRVEGNQHCEDQCCKTVQLTPSQLDGRPLLAFFESGAPTFFPSDLGSLALSEDILAWAGNIIEGGSIEYIDSSTLARLVKESPTLVVFFGDKANAEVLASLEGIDDDLDGHEIPFVMSDDANMAGEFDIETFPAVVAFQRGLPHIFDGKASDSAAVLEWIFELNGLWLKSSEGSESDEEASKGPLDDKDPHYYLVRRKEGEADQTFVVGEAPSVVLVSAGGVSVYKSEKLIKPVS